MHPENWPNTIKESEYFCISDLTSQVTTPLDQAHVLDLFKYIGYPFKFEGFSAGSMVLASEKIGPLPIKLKYLDRVTKLSQEEVEKFYKCMESTDNDMASKIKDIMSKFSHPQQENPDDIIEQ
jgi:hypothetical protein